jgi:DNA-binding PadR family transcriptional regulator
MSENMNRYLPLSEATAYILMALSEPLHGYGVMKSIEVLTQGAVKVGPGTLYGALSTLKKQGLISMVDVEERRKIYQLTPKGKQVLKLHIEHTSVIVENGKKILAVLEQSI